MTVVYLGRMGVIGEDYVIDKGEQIHLLRVGSAYSIFEHMFLLRHNNFIPTFVPGLKLISEEKRMATIF